MSTIDFTKNDTYRRTYDNIFQIKKHVNSKDELPTLGSSNGDVYSVGEDNELYIFNSGWKHIGSGGGNEGVYGLRLWHQIFGKGSGYCWIGNFGDLADAVDAWKAGTLKDIYLDRSYYYGEEDYSFGRINVNDYNYIHCPDEYDEDFYQITALAGSESGVLLRRLTFDNRFTTDSMRFMGDVYESMTEDERPELIPCVMGGDSPTLPLIFCTGIGWTNDECIASCVMATVGNTSTLKLSRLIPASGRYYSFKIDSPLQLENDLYYGTVREVVEEPNQGTLPDLASGPFVLNEGLAKSLIGKRVIVEKVSHAPAPA